MIVAGCSGSDERASNNLAAGLDDSTISFRRSEGIELGKGVGGPLLHL
jgi:hypothetical protein